MAFENAKKKFWGYFSFFFKFWSEVWGCILLYTGAYYTRVNTVMSSDHLNFGRPTALLPSFGFHLSFLSIDHRLSGECFQLNSTSSDVLFQVCFLLLSVLLSNLLLCSLVASDPSLIVLVLFAWLLDSSSSFDSISRFQHHK